ncbi:MAG: sulfite exporter TauE/SafE family protein [Chloroflexota bacterium]
MDFHLHIYLPVADTSVNVLALVGLGFVVGCLSGLFGVGGGFLMTPLLIMLGIPAAQAAASDSCQIVGASSSGAVAHTRMGNVDIKLGLTLLVGGLVGGTIGVQIVSWLRSLGNFDCWIRIVYVLVLGTVGSLMLRESMGALVQNWIYSLRHQLMAKVTGEGYAELRPRLVAAEEPDYQPFESTFARLPLQTTFAKAELKASYLLPLALGLLVGVLTALMGVGGGFIMVPAMTYLLGVSTRVAIGTSLFQMVLTSINITYQQAVTNQTVDVVLAVLLLVGSAIGAQVGARFGKTLKGHQLRMLLGLLVLAVTVKLLLELTLPPETYMSLGQATGGH